MYLGYLMKYNGTVNEKKIDSLHQKPVIINRNLINLKSNDIQELKKRKLKRQK